MMISRLEEARVITLETKNWVLQEETTRERYGAVEE
jgi:predicted GH43/DUF377 family glycosyl hydrolase